MAKRQAPFRVIQWGTGAVGKYCIQRTIESSHLRQVGARVFSDAKNGRDVGEIAHLSPTGVKAAMDKQAVYDADADIVLYTPLIVDLDDICAILASGGHGIRLAWVEGEVAAEPLFDQAGERIRS